jgi:catechol 2,3-dioxygenase-like lactoylglutathione lyase family enzyme
MRHLAVVFTWRGVGFTAVLLSVLASCVAPDGGMERGEGVADFDAQITFCYTADLARTARFYEEVLGLPLALDQGTCRIYEVAGGGFLGFCEHEDGASPEGVILTLVTDDVDGWHARLSQRGVNFEKEPAHNPKYRIYHCFLRDPNGYLIEIQRFDDPRWSRNDGD